jgi:3alpha(or 20beta)-hydroxysteroid dehydrogenase
MAVLEDKVAIVTGGARGIGAAIVELFAAEGARVLATDILDDEGRQLAERAAGSVRYAHLDVTRERDWQESLATTKEDFGPVSVLVNNAGIVELGPIETTSLESFQHVLDVNLVGQFLGIKSVAPSMRRAGGGSVVNISSDAGLTGYNGLASYVASKWAVRGLTKAAALELSSAKIRVNSVHPGFVRTPMTAGVPDSFADTQPIPRPGDPIEIARLVLFLASDQSSYCTGSEFVADGGVSAGHKLEDI